MEMTGAKIVLEILKEHEVDTVFGYPGGAILSLYDELYNNKDKIKHILTSHEQHAAHAADGYSRASGKTGVVFATSGPGATNLVTGIATAFMDSIPMVAITCNVDSSLIGRDAFQEISITGITMPITKHNYFINDIDDLADALRNAFKIANSGRKGPVLVDITKDVTADIAEFTPSKPLPLREKKRACKSEICAVAKLINKSLRPVIYFGGGVVSADAKAGLYKLLKKADIPAAHTLMGSGVLASDLEQNLGLIGMHGSFVSNKTVDKADLVIALGTRFSDRVALNMKKFAKDATIVHVDIDPCEINKNIAIDMSVESDVLLFLSDILGEIEEIDRSSWIADIKKWSESKADRAPKDTTLRPSDIISAVWQNMQSDNIYVTDVGQHQMWAAQFLNYKDNDKFITSGGLGTMGFGYGAAVGASFANPSKPIIHITGDGSFHMNIAEISTAVSHNLPIISIVFNNKNLGMVYQLQKFFYNERYIATTPKRSSDFAKIAEGFGANGYNAATKEEFEAVFKKALHDKCPVVINCDISGEELVLPMIPSGKTVDDIIID